MVMAMSEDSMKLYHFLQSLSEVEESSLQKVLDQINCAVMSHNDWWHNYNSLSASATESEDRGRKSGVCW